MDGHRWQIYCVNRHLTVLHLDCTNIDDRGATVLGTGISRNATLREIRFNRIEGITNIGWNAITSALQLSSCRLEKLDLSWNGLKDAVILSLSKPKGNPNPQQVHP
jgi:hypothetical protein